VPCSWRENPHERPPFRGLATFFREKSFSGGVLERYEIAKIEPPKRFAKKLEEDSAAAAAVINDALRDVSKRTPHQSAAAAVNVPPAKKDKKRTVPAVGSVIDDTIEETAIDEKYVDLLGKVRQKKIGEARGSTTNDQRAFFSVSLCANNIYTALFCAQDKYLLAPAVGESAANERARYDEPDSYFYITPPEAPAEPLPEPLPQQPGGYSDLTFQEPELQPASDRYDNRENDRETL
jgi:hypothetical protein